jgi:hypothetical protein
MRKIIGLALIMLVCSSFINYPCHPAGDLGPCTHRIHSTDTGPCTHVNFYGYRVHDFDYYPNTHPTHSAGDIYPCTHICY